MRATILNPSQIISEPRIWRHPAVADAPVSVEELAFCHGATYDSYLATEPDRQIFRARDVPGAVAYVADGRYRHLAGGLLASPQAKEQLLAEVVRWADRERLLLSFYNLTDDDLPLVREHGFQVTKWGEEAIVDLSTCNWLGKPYEWVRRQTSYCRRQGLIVREYDRKRSSVDEWNRVATELHEVSQSLLVDKPQREEIRFLEGRFDPDRLGRRRLFVAQSNHGLGRVEGFLLCNPCLNGRRWAFETYRRRPDAVRGTMPYLMHQAMQLMQSEDVDSISLCLVPGVRCETPLPGDSPLARWSVVLATRYFSFIHNTSGMYHYKSRFRPQFMNRYLAVRPRLSLGAAWSFVRVLGVLELDVSQIVRQAARRFRSAASRRTLLTPASDARD